MNNETEYTEALKMSSSIISSYDDFNNYYETLLLLKPDYIRKGQALMTLITFYNLPLYESLMKNPKESFYNDSYYNDNLIDNTLNYIKTNWNNENKD